MRKCHITNTAHYFYHVHIIIIIIIQSVSCSLHVQPIRSCQAFLALQQQQSIAKPIKQGHLHSSRFNPLIATLKPPSNGPSYSNTVIGTLAVDGWAVTFGTARRGLGGAAARPSPSSLYQT